MRTYFGVEYDEWGVPNAILHTKPRFLYAQTKPMLDRHDISSEKIRDILYYGDWETLSHCLRHPCIAPHNWASYAWFNPNEALQNPALPLWELELGIKIWEWPSKFNKLALLTSKALPAYVIEHWFEAAIDRIERGSTLNGWVLAEACVETNTLSPKQRDRYVWQLQKVDSWLAVIHSVFGNKPPVPLPEV